MDQEIHQIVEQMRNSETEKLTDSSTQTNTEITTRDPSHDVCPLCKGTGWMFVDYNTVKECDCGLLEKERQGSKLRFAAIPDTYKGITLKDITTKHYKDQANKEIFKSVAKLVKWYLENLYENIEKGKGIYFWSNTKGSGKTMLAAALANELVNEHHRYVKFATSLDILDEIRATYDRKDRESEDNESKLLKDLVTSEFLVIDDFGTERATDWAGEKFYQIVNKRYINKKVTFYTSNYDLQTLKYDDRITNRIKERSFIAHFPEESVREVIARLENNFERIAYGTD